MSDQLVLIAETGRETGSRPSRRLRREGRVPAVVYGLDRDPVAVSVAWPELRRVLTTEAGLNAVITLRVGDDEELTMVKEIQRHPVRRDVLHVDFVRVAADVAVEVEVPIELVGEPVEVQRADGMVDQVLHTLTVSARPADVPDVLRLDISGLEIGDVVRVGDLELPAGVTTDVDADEAVATAVVTRSTLEAMAAEEGEEAAAEAGEAGEAAGEADADAGDD
ncbi:MAG: 50S ribosomal protein L25 [Actinomyces sp.]|nr:MAG: 50S ribosomal protein L25 [Actinomyces sp.]